MDRRGYLAAIASVTSSLISVSGCTEHQISENKTKTRTNDSSAPTTYSGTTSSDEAKVTLSFGQWATLSAYDAGVRVNGVEFTEYIVGRGKAVDSGETVEVRVEPEGKWVVVNQSVKPLREGATLPHASRWGVLLADSAYRYEEGSYEEPTGYPKYLVANNRTGTWEDSMVKDVEFDPPRSPQLEKGVVDETWFAIDIPESAKESNPRVGYNHSSGEGWMAIWQ